jgi:predicted permease
MEAAFILARQILIMFIYMGIGYILFKKGLITKEGSKSLANLLLYCILPCVVIRSLAISQAETGSTLVISFIISIASLALSMFISKVLFHASPTDDFSSAFSNAGFMGFPLIAAILGGKAVFYAAGFVALLNALQWTYGQWILSKNKTLISGKAVLQNPIVVSMFIGLIIFATNVQLPSILTDTMNSIAILNAPIAMTILGVYMAQTDLKKMFVTVRLYYVSIVRLLVIPCLTLVMIFLLPQPWHKIAAPILIAAAAPVGSNVAVYAQKLNLDYTYAVQVVCVSTILSIIFMPLVIGLAATLGCLN